MKIIGTGAGVAATADASDTASALRTYCVIVGGAKPPPHKC